jgi:hypothetical protein
MKLLVVRSYPAGPRIWVGGRRLHHGAIGCVLAVLGVALRKRPILLGALLLALHDRADWRVWFKREGLDLQAGMGYTHSIKR